MQQHAHDDGIRRACLQVLEPPSDVIRVAGHERRNVESGDGQEIQRATHNVRLQGRRILRLARQIPHGQHDLLRPLAHNERIDVELDRALVDRRRTWRARTQAALQRGLARLSVAEQYKARAVGRRLARCGELLEVAPDRADALPSDCNRRLLQRVVLEL